MNNKSAKVNMEGKTMSAVVKKNRPKHASKGLSPLWDDFARMERQMENMFAGLMPRSTTATSAAASMMSVVMDVKESPNTYQVTAELPGVEESEIDVSYKDGLLTISGEKSARETCEEGENWHRMERSYGSFTRSFHFRDIVDEEHIKADYESGVLTVTLPKIQTIEKEPKHIAIGK